MLLLLEYLISPRQFTVLKMQVTLSHFHSDHSKWAPESKNLSLSFSKYSSALFPGVTERFAEQKESEHVP